jgi:hypothetical protein
MKVRNVLLGVLMATVLPGAMAAQTSITVPPGCCGNYIHPWGTTYVFGQTFMAPSDPNTLLQDINVSVFSLNGGQLFYRAHLYAWGGSGTTGNSLFSSAEYEAPGSTSWSPINIAIGGLNLTANQTYVFFLQGTSGTGEYGQSAGDFNDPYADGRFVYSGDGGASWADLGSQYDLAFEANFTATPEPASMLLMATGLSGVAAWRRRRRKSEALA